MNTHELAWAAGFFDGEGSTMVRGKAKRVGLSLPQREREPLDRFMAAMRGRGTICQCADRMFVYQAASFEDAQFVIASMWRFLSGPKRRQAKAAFAAYYSHGLTMERGRYRKISKRVAA